MLKSLAKRLRAWPPLNLVATGVTRAITRAIGWQPEFIPKHLHKVGRVSCVLPNGRTMQIASRGDDWVSNRLFWYGWKGYEPETTPIYCALAAQSPVTIDVGSYVGYYTILAAVSNPASTVYAFEPLPAIYQRLVSNIRLNGLTNVVTQQAAVGEAAATAEFYYSTVTELPTSSSLSHEFMADAPQLHAAKVPVIRLDDFVSEHRIARVGLMKIDTETTEPQVLRGARVMLERDRPHIVCEILRGHETSGEIERLLKPLGYRFYLPTPDGLMLRESIDPHPEYLNYLLTTLEEEELRAL